MKHVFQILFFSTLILCLSQNGYSQVFSGVVKAEGMDERLPFVNIFVPGSTKGTATDENGNFTLELESTDFQIEFSILGYKPKIIPINIQKDSFATILLEPEDFQLEAVEIVGKKENLGRKIVKKVIDNRDRVNQRSNVYSANIYQKNYIERFQEIPKDDTTGIEEGWVTASMSESFARSYFDGKKFKKVIKAELINVEDKSLQEYGRIEIDRSFRGSNLSVKYNILEFFREPEDVAIDLYQNQINNAKIADRPITSPIGVGAMSNYRYKLTKIDLTPSGDSIFTVSVEPIFKQAPLFSGELVIDGTEFLLKSTSLTLPNNVNPLFKNFVLEMDYTNVDSTQFSWKPHRKIIRYDAKLDSKEYKVETQIVQDSFTLNPTFEKNFFNNELVVYEMEALERNLDIWKTVRPNPLAISQEKFVYEQDSVWRYEHSDEYYRIQDSIYNHNTYLNFLFSGIGWKRRKIGLTLFFEPILSLYQPIGVGGDRLNFAGTVKKEFLSANELDVGYRINYGLRNEDWKARLKLGYMYWPQKFSRIYGSVGDVYDLLTPNQSIEAIFSPQNFIRHRSLGLGHSIEVVNGIYLDASLRYSLKTSIDDLNLPAWSEELFGTFGEPIQFEEYRALIFNAEIIIKFNQKYITRGRKKIVLSSKLPTLKFVYNKGLPSLFQSEVDFDQFETEIYHRPRPTKLGSTNWRVSAGGFLSMKRLRFIEEKFIRGSDLYLFSDPLRNFQLLGPTISTNKPYYRGAVVHHFDGFIMDKIPLINYLQLELIAGAGAITIPSLDFSHAEVYAGVGRKVRLWGETVQFAFYTLSSLNTVDQYDWSWKLGVNFFDAFNGQWMY